MYSEFFVLQFNRSMMRTAIKILMLLVSVSAYSQLTPANEYSPFSNAEDYMHDQFTLLNGSDTYLDAAITLNEAALASAPRDSAYTNSVIAINTTQIQDTLRVFSVLSSFNGIPGAIPNDNLSDTAGINSAIRAARGAAVFGSDTFGDFPTVLIPGGRYDIDGPIFPLSYVHVEAAKTAYFVVPAGYTGNFMEFADNTFQESFYWSGGMVTEAFSQQRLWTGIKINKSTSHYVAFSTIRDLKINYAGTGIDLDLTSGGWTNANLFDNITIEGFVNGLWIDDGGGGGSNQSRGNTFNLTLQASGFTEVGVFEAATEYNIFNITFWDFDVAPAGVKVVDAKSPLSDWGQSKKIPLLNNYNSEFEGEHNVQKVATKIHIVSDGQTADTIMYLPNSTVVWDLHIKKTIGFDDSGTDLLDVGTTVDEDYFVNDADISGTGWHTMSFNNAPPQRIFNNNYIIMTYTGQNSDAANGMVEVYIRYSLK